MESGIFSKRMSVRKFKPNPVPQEVVKQLLCAAINAPSAGNLQPWHFYVVQHPTVKEQLCECAYNQKFIKKAPVVIVVCAEPARSAERYADRGRELYAIQDTAAAIENLLLCATANGLGACWCGAFDEEAVKKVMEIPTCRRPVAILPLGYPKGLSMKPKRRAFKEVVTTVE